MRRVTSLFLAACVLLLAGCAGSGDTQATSEFENRRQLCQKWTGNPDDPECLSTFRRILP
jgi:hypothetical protein